MRAASRGLGGGCGVTDGRHRRRRLHRRLAGSGSLGARGGRAIGHVVVIVVEVGALRRRMPCRAAAGIASDGRLPSAARAASALVTAFSTVSGDVPFSRCLRITSWRCLSRRRSSRQAPNRADPVADRTTRVAADRAGDRAERQLRDHQQRQEQGGQHQHQRARAIELIGQQAGEAGAERAAGGERLAADRQPPERDGQRRAARENSTTPPANLVHGAVSARTQK